LIPYLLIINHARETCSCDVTISAAYQIRPRQVYSRGQETLVLHDLHAGTGVEHDDDLALIQDICGSVNYDSREVLEFQGRSVKVHPLAVREDVESITPLRVSRPQTNLDGGRIVAPRCAKLRAMIS